MGGVGLFGGAFDPPHNGHIALVEGAQALGLDRFVILVSEAPEHKPVHAPAAARLQLAAAAFPGHEVELDPYGRTIDMLRGVLFFDIPAVDVSSSEVRRRVAAGEAIDGLVPDAVSALIAELCLYR